MTALSSPSHGRWSPVAFVLLVIAACGGRTSEGSVAGSGMSSGTTAGAMSGASSGTASGSLSGATSGVVSSGAGASSGSVSSGAVSSGTVASSGTVSSGAIASSGTIAIMPMGDAGPDSGNPLVVGAIPSAGCGKALTLATGMWVSQPTGCAPGANNQGTASCQAIPPGSTVPATATQGSPENRGWWVYLPTGYDASKPYPVIYSTPGCDDPNWFHAGADGFPYYNVDNGQAIQVGLDYDTFSESPGCGDRADPESNDFVFMPWLMTEIENTFCVDTTREWFSEYADVGSLAQQFDCAFPARLRGQVVVSGWEPGSPAAPYPNTALPTCHPAPTAAFYVHDINDTDDPYVGILPGCSRVLQQNGCANTKCDPSDTTITTPYAVPAGVNLKISNGTCVKFSGCPAAYPVVFCTTNYAENHHADDQYMGVVPLFWDFIDGLPSACPAGQVFQNGACGVCPGGAPACGGACVDIQTDSNNCGACGTSCPAGGTCQGGACACPSGANACDGACVDIQTDSRNCGTCRAVCPGGAACNAGVCTCPSGDVVCGGVCVNEQADPNNCGACDKSCPGSHAVCQAGACVCRNVCAGLCVDEQTDPNFCGACDNSCPGSAPFCRSGVCSAN